MSALEKKKPSKTSIFSRAFGGCGGSQPPRPTFYSSFGLTHCNPLTNSGKRTANLKLTLNKRAVEAHKPGEKPFIAWDDKLTGFGVRVQPSPEIEIDTTNLPTGLAVQRVFDELRSLGFIP